MVIAEERYRALVVDKDERGVVAQIRDLRAEDFPPNEVTVAVESSDLNYKDGLAVTGQGPILRAHPMVPGIDFAGRVVDSTSPDYRPGDPVVATGWGIGERTWGGFAQRARAKAEWLVPLPEGLSLRQSMAIGTAGLTAVLCLMALEEQGLTPASASGREVVVTGAAGGVGGIAVALLSAQGYTVTAVTGRADAHEYLREIGASEVIGRDALPLGSTRPLESQRWAAAIDTVGGDLLAAVLRQISYYGAVASCGNAGGTALSTTVLPFILRGIRLIGVESVLCPRERRRIAWQRLASGLPLDRLDRMTRIASLTDVPALAQAILRGQVRGRVVIDVSA